MSEFGVEAREYGQGRWMAAALVTGFAGNLRDYESAIRTLNERGYDVVGYEYPPDILLSGDPSLLPNVINEINRDFKERSTDHESVRFAGFSLGAAIALNLQRGETRPMEPGLYAGAGVSVSRVVMHHPAFHFSRVAFMRGGYGPKELNDAWRPLHDTVGSPVAVALGGLDHIVPYVGARLRFADWERTGTPVHVVTLPFMGHQAVKQWYVDNIGELAEAAEILKPAKYLA